MHPLGIVARIGIQGLNAVLADDLAKQFAEVSEVVTRSTLEMNAEGQMAVAIRDDGGLGKVTIGHRLRFFRAFLTFRAASNEVATGVMSLEAAGIHGGPLDLWLPAALLGATQRDIQQSPGAGSLQQPFGGLLQSGEVRRLL
jgi:hypothetical protein